MRLKIDIKTPMDKALKRKGLMLKEIYDITGLSHTAINRMRQEGDGKLSNVAKIASALNIPFSHFVTDLDSPNQESESMVNEPNPTYNDVECYRELEFYKKLCTEKDERIKLLEQMLKR